MIYRWKSDRFPQIKSVEQRRRHFHRLPSLSGVHARCATASIGALTSSGNPADSFSLPFSCRSAIPFLRLIPFSPSRRPCATVFLLDHPNLVLATTFFSIDFPLFFSLIHEKKKVENVLISTNFESNIFFTRNFLTIKF